MTPATWTIRFKGYLPVDDRMEERLRRVCAEIDELPGSALDIDKEARVITIDYSQVKGWLEASKELVRTVHVGERIVVKPPWDDYEARTGEIVLEIDPGPSFGSGLHESTCLCLRALEKYVKPGIRAVDFGTGSGILAIAAVKLGAACVTAVDADPDAVRAARENVERNHLQGVIEVRQAEEPAALGSQVDLVAANITAETITSHLEGLAGLLKCGGVLICSGMTFTTSPAVERSLPGAGFDVVEKLTEGPWAALVSSRP